MCLKTVSESYNNKKILKNEFAFYDKNIIIF